MIIGTKVEFENLADYILRDYLGSEYESFKPFDVNAFAKDYLKLDISYCEFNPEDNIEVMRTGNQILLDQRLSEPTRVGERNFTIAHECGHILCRHVLYHSIASYLLLGADALGILGALTVPIQYAILYWQRQSELSCDRCASIVTSPEVVARSMARLSGGPKVITNSLNMEEWVRQADKYDAIKNDGLWNKTLQLSVTLGQSHPFSAVRVREILKWGKSPQYKNLMERLDINSSSKTCDKCKSAVSSEWGFCKYCGNKLK